MDLLNLFILSINQSILWMYVVQFQLSQLTIYKVSLILHYLFFVFQYFGQLNQRFVYFTRLQKSVQIIIISKKDLSQQKRKNQIINLIKQTNTQMGQPIKQFYHWYMSKSIITKLYFTSSLLLFILMYFDFTKIENIFINYDTLSNLQLWRLFTALVYEHSYSILTYPIKFYISYSILVNFQQRLYNRQNYKQYAQFLWLMSIVWTIVNIVTLAFDYYVTNHFFFMCLCFIWAKKTPNSSLNLCMGISVPVYYLPYIYAIYYWVVGIIGFWVQLAVAVVLGYVYYYMKIYSLSYYGKDYLSTPTVFQLLVEKYLILQQRLGLYKPLIQQELQDQDPYSQYGYYTNTNTNQQQQQQQQRQQLQQQQQN